jgi:hypothetical protein
MGRRRYDGSICEAWERINPERDADLQRHDPPRTKASDPYSFDPYTIWGFAGPNPQCNATDWTDRLWEWNYAKCERLTKEVYPPGSMPFSDYGCRGDLIQEFLRRYHDDESIVLLRVIAYCNASNGFPLWRLDYKTSKAGHARL